MSFTHALSTNNYGSSKFIVDASAANGTHTTIASALTSASSGDTIFIRPGTYTENLTLKAGVNLTASIADGSPSGSSNVIIVGKSTFTAAGTVNISGIQLSTNSDFFLAVTGSAASVVNLNNCYLNCSNNTGISFTVTNTSAQIIINNSYGNLGTTGIALIASSSTGNFFQNFTGVLNSGASTTANTFSAGNFGFNWSSLGNPVTTSGTAGISFIDSSINSAAQNATALTSGGSGTNICKNCFFASGSASAVSIGSSTTLSACVVNSSNTNAVTGASTLINAGVFLSGTSQVINTTTQTARNLAVGGVSFDGGTNNLQNYATGTFTPTIVGAAVAGITTYTAQNGYYTRIGNLVTVQANVAGSAATGTGAAIFGGLPFTVKNQTGGNSAGAVFSANNATWVFPVGTTSQVFDATLNSTTASIYVSGTATAGGSLQMANAAFNFFYTMTYQI